MFANVFVFVWTFCTCIGNDDETGAQIPSGDGIFMNCPFSYHEWRQQIDSGWRKHYHGLALPWLSSLYRFTDYIDTQIDHKYLELSFLGHNLEGRELNLGKAEQAKGDILEGLMQLIELDWRLGTWLRWSVPHTVFPPAL